MRAARMRLASREDPEREARRKIAELVATWPPLTAEQVAELRELLLPVRRTAER